MLDGIRVLEAANVITGPLAGMLLADLGAEVIKIESPSGDPFRRWQAEESRIEPAFAACNRGKASVVLNLKERAGQEIFRSLAATADVVLENSRPGVMDRLGVGWLDLQPINTRLIYCSITGLGSEGPEARRPTFDAVAQGFSGLWSHFIDLDRPEVVGPPLADQLTGLYTSIAILAALRDRDASGEGRHIEVSMLASCLAFQPFALADLAVTGRSVMKTSRARQSQSYAFIAGDGLPFAIHLSSPPKFWSGLCRTVGMEHLEDDPRFSNKESRIRNYTVLQKLLEPTFAIGSRDEWLARLEANDVPAAPILKIEEAASHPQVQATGILSVDSKNSSLKGLPRSPVRTEGQYLASDRPPPALGEHTEEVLASVGFSAAQRDSLRAAGVIP